MEIVLKAQFKNGLLYKAVKKCGNQRKLAEYLGVSQRIIGDWLNFNAIPRFRKSHNQYRAKYEGWDAALVDLVGYGLDEIFPQELEDRHAEIKGKARMEIAADMPIDRLIQAGACPKMLEAPDAGVHLLEFREQITTAFSGKSPRIEKVIRMRFGLDGDSEQTLEQVAQHLGVTRERVRQIELEGLRLLRHPSRSKMLKPYCGMGVH